MVMRAFFLLAGFLVAVSGGISIVAYLNLLASGIDYKGYMNFILNQPECYLLPIGILIITISIFWPSNSMEE